jgi:hypothetical protein
MNADKLRPDNPRRPARAAEAPAATYAQAVSAKVHADLEVWTRRLIGAAEAVNASAGDPRSGDQPPQIPLGA